jgi:uncharacterized protein
VDRDALRSMALDGWNAVAPTYVEKLFHELDDKPFDRGLLDRFVTLAHEHLPVLDLGCGPGHVSKHLLARGLAMHGIDLSPEMIRLAKELVPGATFDVGDLLALDLPPSAFGGALLLYSLINLVPEDVPAVLRSVAGALAARAPVLLAVHAGEGFRIAENVMGRDVRMVASLFTLEQMTSYVEGAGFDVVYATTRPPYATEYANDRVYVLGRRRPS